MKLTKEIATLIDQEWQTHLKRIAEAMRPNQVGDLIYRAVVWASSLQQKFDSVLAEQSILFAQIKEVIPFEFNTQVLDRALLDAWSKGDASTIKDAKLVNQLSNHWKRGLAYTASGKIRNSLANYITILSNDPDWKGKLFFDPLLKEPFNRKGSPLDGVEYLPEGILPAEDAKSVVNDAYGLNPLELTAEIYGRVAVWFQTKYDLSLSNEGSIYLPLVASAMKEKVNHATKWAKALKWDGVSRIVPVGEAKVSDFARCFHDDEEYLAEVVTPFLRIFILSYVTRMFHPGKKVDTILILEGFKGARKSTSMKLLVPNERYFSDSPIDWTAKDGMMMGNGLLIYEVAELERIMRRTNPAKFKAWLRSKEDRYRPPWERGMQIFPRTFVPYGTVNAEGAWLKDYGEERVYMPIRIARKIDTAKIAEMRDQLIAESVALLKAGWAYWPSTEDAEVIAREMTTRMLPNLFTENLEEVIRRYGITFVRTAEIAKLLDNINPSDPRVSDALAGSFRQLGWRYARVRRIAGAQQGWLAPESWVNEAPPKWPSLEPPVKGVYATQLGLSQRLSLLGRHEQQNVLPLIRVERS